MRIAVVGAGVAGLVAAHRLARRHAVVLFEADSRPGGHAHTVDVLDGGERLAIDAGFVVFNHRTYPRFTRLLDELGVMSQPSDMSFSVRSEARDFEYGGSSLNALFAQRRHLVSPRFARMVRDIVRFGRDARQLLAAGPELSLAEFARQRGYSRAFLEDHLLPMVAAIWSSNTRRAELFPARFLARFFDHHGLLRLTDRPQWRTVVGGSRRYVQALLAAFAGEVRLGAAVDRVCRREGQAIVRSGGAAEPFDHVVLACHADDGLRLIGEPSPREATLLGAFRYQTNAVTLHTDTRVMPRRRRAWASWNYHLDHADRPGASVTYWMNRLQMLAGTTHYFVTVNRDEIIDPARIRGRYTYSHPVFSEAAVAAQAEHAQLIDHDRVSFCGAYWGNGFHEDGVASALRVAERLGVAA